MRKNDDDENEPKPQDDESSINDWVCGGPIGTKGAVLVFRSCVLASQTPSMDSPNRTIGNNTGTAILLNKAKNMAKRLVAEPHSFNMRPKNIMHDVLETFGNAHVYTGNAYIVKHESKTEDTTVNENGEPKRDIQDVLNDLSKITLKRNLNVENTTANIKIFEEQTPAIKHKPFKFEGRPKNNEVPEKSPSPKSSRKPKSSPNSKPQNMTDFDECDLSENSLIKQIDNFKVIESNNMPARILNVTYKLVNTETKLLNRLLQAHGLEEAPSDSKDFNLLWSGLHPKPDVLRSLAPYQRVNHFPRSYELTRKDKLFKNIEKMQYFRGLKHFDFIPTTFLMPLEYKELCTTHYRTKGPWIVKPAASSRGRGIYIVNTPEQIPKGDSVVVAKYIDKPLLINGHKCDLRLYVCVTCIDPLLIYLYEEGLVRFATVKYDSSNKNLWNPCMHLCNYSINKYHTDYIKCDDPNAGNIGHKWTLSALLRHLRKQGRNTTQLMANIEDLVIKSILSSAQTITSASRAFVPNFFNCFELFGYDILIDDTLKPWLLEINLSPSLGCDSPLDARVKSALIADTLTLVGLPAVAASGKVDHINSLKMRIGACRRVHSAENACARGNNGKGGSSGANMTSEEARLVRAVKAQYCRRGGFVRIFPAQNSWQKYSQYLDPVSGVPVCSTSVNNPSGVLPHNYNLLLHSRLLPPNPNPHTPERLKRYEAVTVTSTAPAVTLADDRSPPVYVDNRRAKDKIKQQLMDGSKLSGAETRRAFGLFLSHVLKRIGGCHHPQAAPLAAVVSRFLKRAVTSLRVPYNIQSPTVKMCDKDRCAIVAKQMNDFLYMYYRDTDLCMECEDREGYIPSLQFAQFLCSASEADLEDVLLLVVRLGNQVTPFLGDGRTVYCIDLPRDKLIEHKDHVLLRYLAHIVPLHNRKFRSPDSTEGTVTPLPIATQHETDAIVKDSLKEEKPMNVALKYAKS